MLPRLPDLPNSRHHNKSHRFNNSRAEIVKIIVIAGSSRLLWESLTGEEGVPFLSKEYLKQHWIDSMNQIEQVEAARFIADSVSPQRQRCHKLFDRNSTKSHACS
jgi:hypothetical protein